MKGLSLGFRVVCLAPGLEAFGGVPSSSIHAAFRLRVRDDVLIIKPNRSTVCVPCISVKVLMGAAEPAMMDGALSTCARKNMALVPTRTRETEPQIQRFGFRA